MKIEYPKKDKWVCISDIPFTLEHIIAKLEKENIIYRKNRHYPSSIFGKNISFVIGKTDFSFFENFEHKNNTILSIFYYRKRDLNKLLKILFPDKRKLLVELI